MKNSHMTTVWSISNIITQRSMLRLQLVFIELTSENFKTNELKNKGMIIFSFVKNVYVVIAVFFSRVLIFHHKKINSSSVIDITEIKPKHTHTHKVCTWYKNTKYRYNFPSEISSFHFDNYFFIFLPKSEQKPI